MKTICLSLLLILACISINAQDAVFRKLPDGIVPVIDGSIDYLWETVEIQNIEKPYILDYAEPTIDSATWRAVWNDTSIFILIMVNEDNHCDQWCSGATDWQSDRPELYFDVNDNLFDGGGPGNAPGHYQIAPAFVEGQDWFYFSSSDWWTGVNNPVYINASYQITDPNYVYEYEIRIADLYDNTSNPLNPNTIDTIGFDVTITDRDDYDTDRKRAVWMNDATGQGGTEAWNNMDDCGTVVFSNVFNTEPTLIFTTPSGSVPNNLLYDMGAIKLGSTKEDTLILRNIGEQDLIISTVTLSGQGYSISTLQDSTLSLNESQQLIISFTESTDGIYNGTLEIVSNNAIKNTLTINLTIDNYGGSLTHSWDFENGTANDVVGAAHGKLIGGASVTNGDLVTTKEGQYMELPADIISINTYSEITTEAWYTSTPGANLQWHMLYYFGNSINNVGVDGLYFQPDRGDDWINAGISCGNETEPWIVENGVWLSPQPEDGILHHTITTITDTTISLYIDGELIGTEMLTGSNSIANLSNNFAWLAKSGYRWDPTWQGSIHLFNIYNEALSEEAVQNQYQLGTSIKSSIIVTSPGGKTINNSTYNMGAVKVDSTKNVTFTLSNFGQQDLVISSMNITGQGFSIVSLPDSTLSSFETQPLTISFSYNEVGIYEGILEIICDDTTTISLTIGTSENIGEGKAEITKLPEGVAPVIDGIVDSIWDNYGIYSIEKNHVTNYSKATLEAATWRATWNDTAIFILVEVSDDNHCDQWCAEADPWNADRVEIFLDVNDELIDGQGPEGYPNGHYQFAPDWQQGIDSFYYSGDDWRGDHFNYAYVLNDPNYVKEYAIPLSSLVDKNGKTLSPLLIDQIGFDIRIIDRDQGDEGPRTIAWNNDGIGPGTSNAEILVTHGDAPLIARFETGVEFYEGAGTSPAGPRTYFGFGNDNTQDEFGNQIANFFPLTDNAKSAYLAEIKRMLGNSKNIIYITPDDRENENIQFLKSNGLNIIKYWPANTLGSEPQSTIDLLNSAGLVIIGRSGASSNFQQEADVEAWNGLYSPVMLICQWKSRSSRLKWFNSANTYHWNDSPDTLYAQILNPTDSIFQNVIDEYYDNWVDWCIKPHDLISVTSTIYLWNNMDDAGAMTFVQTEPALIVTSPKGGVANNSIYNMGSCGLDSTTNVTFNLINKGKTDLVISDLNITGQGYSISTLPDSTLSKDETQSLTVSFTSSQVGNHEGTLEIVSNDAANDTFYINFVIGTALILEEGSIVINKLPNGVAPVIDGTIDDLWDTVGVNSIEKPFIHDYAEPTLDLATWQAVWNDTAIFVLIRVEENDFCPDYCSGAADWQSDKVEIWLDVNDELEDGLGPSAWYSGHYQYAPDFVQGFDQYTWDNYGTVNNAYLFSGYSVNGNNYNYEYSIRIADLLDKDGDTLNPYLIDEMGFDVYVIDRDTGDLDRKRAVWKNDGVVDECWNNMDDAGTVVFSPYEPVLSIITSQGAITNNSSYSLGYVASDSIKEVTLTLRNIGQQDLNISSILVTGTGFSVTPPADLSLEWYENQSLIISFTESTMGIYEGTLKIVSNDAVNDTFFVNLSIGVNLTVIEGGIVSGIWYKEQSPYYIFGNIIVPDKLSLTIEPGVEVIFAGHYYFQIEGKLLASGQAGDSILFSVIDTSGISIYDTTGFSNYDDPAGSWQGLYIFNEGQMNDNDSSKLEYCIIEFAKSLYGEKKDAQGGGLFDHGFPRLLINYCAFRNNVSYYDGGAIYARAFADIDIFNSTFINNRSLWGQGGAIHVIDGSKPTIYNNIISQNETAYSGAIYAGFNTICEIYNNTIINNVSSYARPAGICFESSNSYFINNVVANNEAPGDGAACLINNCTPYFYNNNICYNKSQNNVTGGILIWGISPVNFTNNIFWGNEGIDGNCEFNITSSGQPNFYNCIIKGGIDSILRDTVSNNVFKGDSINVYTQDPVFDAAPTEAGINFNGLDADWNVSQNSITINRGKEIASAEMKFNKDIYQNNRIIHYYIDIGAVETHIPSFSVGGAADTIFYDTFWAADTVYVTGEIFVTDSATLTIAPGTVIEFQDHYKFKMRGCLLSKGLPDAMITFTINDATGFENIYSDEGSWHGITLNDDYWDGANFEMQDNDSIIIEYTIIEYAKNMDNNWSISEGGGIQIKYVSKARVSNCIIRNNMAARGAGINIQGFADPVIRNNQIYDNTANYRGGGIFISNNSQPTITGNLITNNESGWGGDLSIDGSNPIIINNVISNNSLGVHLQTSNPVFANNTIVNNSGFGIQIWDCNPEIYNTIIWGNDWDELYADNFYPVIYNCIIQDGIEGIGPWERRDELEIYNLISKNPDFIDPTEGSGTSFTALTADWSVTDLSPTINNGVEPDDIEFPSTDFEGNPRIHQDIIDIGACENQGDQIEITAQPVPQKVCLGDSVTLSFKITGTAKYQWKKNDVVIPWATTSTLTLDPVGLSDEANYSCVVSNGYGSVETNNALLTVQTVPTIIVQPEYQEVCNGDSTIFDLKAGGIVPITYQWYKNDTTVLGATDYKYKINTTSQSSAGVYYCIVTNACGDTYSDGAPLFVHELPQVNLGDDDTVCWNSNYTLDPGIFELYRWNDYTTDRYKLVNKSGSYYVKVTDINGCQNNSDTINITIQEAYVPEIFLVTVDSADNVNQIVWRKPDTNNIVAFNIYKETTTAGEYDIIGTVPYVQKNRFLDTASHPNVKADRYKISIIDNCGESPPSKHHKTIHLSPSENINQGVNLQWSHYEGFKFGTYYIYRNTDKDTLYLIDSVQSNLDSYTDINAPEESDHLFYSIAVHRGEILELVGIDKASAGPFDKSSSNLEDNRLRSENEPPTNIFLSGYMIPENEETGTFIGKFTVADPDVNDTITYTIGSEYSGNTYFYINNDLLYSNYVFDYETQKLYDISVTAADQGGNELVEEFTIHIIDVDPEGGDTNVAPNNIYLMGNSIQENKPVNTFIGEFSTSDANYNDTHTYTLNSGTTEFYLSGDLLYSNQIFDYESTNIYTISVTSVDTGGLQFTKSFNIIIIDDATDENLAPTNIILSGNTIQENKAIGTYIGEFSTIDPNDNDTHTYTLNSGNSNFYIDNVNLLYSNQVFDYESENNYSISITSEDNGGEQFTKSFTIIIDNGVAIDDHTLNDQFMVYPNPSKGIINIRLNEISNSVATIEILNSIGNIVYYEENVDIVNQKDHQIILYHQNSGLYILRIIDDKNVYQTTLIIQ